MRKLSLILSLSLLSALSLLAADTLTVRFPRPEPQGASETQAILLDDRGTLATVYSFGINPERAIALIKDQEVRLELLAHDPVSRLTLLRLPEGTQPGVSPAELGNSAHLSPEKGLRAHGKTVRFAGTEKLFHGQILPLALLRFHYSDKGIRPGEPITDASGEVVAFALEGRIDETAKAGYALPIEVLQRVMRGKPVNKQIQRCWLGLIMDAENTIPALVGLRPNSPAARGGLQKGDILLSIAGRAIHEYADAVNAFYYLRSGQTAIVRVLRGTEILELEVTPEIVPTATASQQD